MTSSFLINWSMRSQQFSSVIYRLFHLTIGFVLGSAEASIIGSCVGDLLGSILGISFQDIKMWRISSCSKWVSYQKPTHQKSLCIHNMLKKIIHKLLSHRYKDRWFDTRFSARGCTKWFLANGQFGNNSYESM